MTINRTFDRSQLSPGNGLRLSGRSRREKNIDRVVRRTNHRNEIFFRTQEIVPTLILPAQFHGRFITGKPNHDGGQFGSFDNLLKQRQFFTSTYLVVVGDDGFGIGHIQAGFNFRWCKAVCNRDHGTASLDDAQVNRHRQTGHRHEHGNRITRLETGRDDAVGNLICQATQLLVGQLLDRLAGSLENDGNVLSVRLKATGNNV